MTTQCDPAKLQVIGEADIIEHFRLPQCHISSLPEGVPSMKRHLDQHVVSLNASESAEFLKSNFVRLSKDSTRTFEGPQLKALRKGCEEAHSSEEFFITVSRNQWLRTTISRRYSRRNLFGRKYNVVHSNVLPYDSYWRRPGGDESSSRVHFPCHILKEADDQGQTLGEKLSEWNRQEVARECDNHEEDDQRRPLKKFWEVLDMVKPVKLTQNRKVSYVTWRGGNFIKKVAMSPEFDAEVQAMERLCHPHIVYIFGMCLDNNQGSLYMECMDSDLFNLIIDKCKDGNNFPPFSRYNSVDILLQIAKAMEHMHQNGLVHGDLKSQNVLVSEFKISEDQCRYLAKIADFGDSQSFPRAFRPAKGTTPYAAPEVLEFRDIKPEIQYRYWATVADFGSCQSFPRAFRPAKGTTLNARPEVLEFRDIKLEISLNYICRFPPEYVDIYSFGCVAFEVLTGEAMRNFLSVVPGFKDCVKAGTWKPPLRDSCRKDNFLYIESLMNLIERCWETGTPERPPQRPLFPEIVKILNAVREQIRQEDAPEVLQEEGASEAVHLEDTRGVAPAPDLLEDDSELEPGPTPNLQEDGSELEPGPTHNLQGGGSELEPGPTPNLQEGGSELEPGPTLHLQEVKPRNRLRRKLKYFFRCFSCASGGTVLD